MYACFYQMFIEFVILEFVIMLVLSENCYCDIFHCHVV